MSEEVSINSKLSVSNGNFALAVGSAYRFDQATVGGGIPGEVTVGTVETPVAFTGITSLGWFWMRNLDATNFVKWGFSTGVYGGRMAADEPAGPFRLEPGTTLYMIADTAACRVQMVAVES